MSLREKNLEAPAEILDGSDRSGPFVFDEEILGASDAMVCALLGIESIARDFRFARLRDVSEVSSTMPQGFSFDRLDVIELIGRGTQGDVWKAYDPVLDRYVALKLHALAPCGFSPRLQHEARTLAKFRHPNIVCIHGAAAHDARCGIWMELLAGRSLAACIAQSNRVPIADALSIGATLCDALAVVHGAGFVHCDVKLENVVREDDGRIVIVDFGAARPIDGASSLPVSGTPAYVAPELFDGALPSASTDVYALGVLLFRLAAGKFPHIAADCDALIDLHARGERCDVFAAAPGLPPRFANALQQALQRQPGSRFGTMREFGAALRGCMI